jgi:hypothetical protein
MAMQNIHRSVVGLIFVKSFAPVKAPPNTPKTTGKAMPGSMYPRCRYTTALAAAVTPIMKLLVVVLTLNGIFMVVSIAKTFKAPEPIPNNPDITPASVMMEKPPPTFFNFYFTGPSGVG